MGIHRKSDEFRETLASNVEGNPELSFLRKQVEESAETHWREVHFS